MSGETNTDKNRSTEDAPKDDAPKVDGPKEEVKVNLESDEAKAAISAKVEEIVVARLAREKSKTETAEAKAKEAQDKLAAAEQTIATLTSDKTAADEARDAALKDVTVLKLSIEEGVTPDLVKSLRGETYDELKAAIKTVVGASKPSVNRIFDGKDTSKPKGEVDMSAIIQKAAKAQRNR